MAFGFTKRLRRRPRITEDNYSKLMTSFGRVVDLDRFVAEPAQAMADRIGAAEAALIAEVDARLYKGAAIYHLRLLAGAWLMAREGTVPQATAEVFEEAVAWKFAPISRKAESLPHQIVNLFQANPTASE